MDTPTSTDGRPAHRGRPTPSQIIALGLVAAAFGWAIWLLDERPSTEEVELLPGTVLPASELAVVEAALDRAELADHHTESGRVWVPRQRHAAYMRALVDAQAMPREFGSSLRRALENDSPWRSRAVQEEILRVAIQDELSHVIRSMPGIERASVLYDAGEKPGFPGASAQRTPTASVNVRTNAETPLEASRVQAIRVLVAASIAGLEAERVAVTDLRSGRVHAGPLEQEPLGPSADDELGRTAARERYLAAKIRQALAFVPGAVVDVTVALEEEDRQDAAASPPPGPALPRLQQRVADANAPAEVLTDEPPPPAPPVAVAPRRQPARIVVTVAVPESSLRSTVGAGLDDVTSPTTPDILDAARERLVTHVRTLLPPAGGGDDHRVVVTTFSTTEHAAAKPVAPTSDARPHSLGSLVDETIASLSDGRIADVPRQAWLALAACLVAIVLWFVLRDTSGGQSRRRERPRRRGQTRIDWESLEDTGDSGPARRPLPHAADAPRGVAA